MGKTITCKTVEVNTNTGKRNGFPVSELTSICHSLLMPYTPRARLTIPALIVAHVLSVCSILVFVGNRSDGHLIARRQTESFAGPQLMKIRHKASSVLDDVSHLSYSGYVASQANNWTADHTLQCCG